MGKNVQGLITSLLSVAFIIIVIGSYVIVAQDAVTGTWKANSGEDVVKFKIFNIDQGFIRTAKAAGPNITVSELVEMKIGVRRSSR